MKGALQILERALFSLVQDVVPGIAPGELAASAADLIVSLGATPILPDERNDRGGRFGFAACVCVNDAAANAVPTQIPLEPGDVVTLDVALAWPAHGLAAVNSAVVDGATTCLVPGGTPDPRTANLRDAARAATGACLAAAHPGVTPGTLRGIATQAAVRFGVRLAEVPLVHRVGQGGDRLHVGLADLLPLQAGDVIAIEPIVIDGDGTTLRMDPDGFTLRTGGGEFAAYEECTMVVGDDEAAPRVLPPTEWRPWLAV